MKKIILLLKLILLISNPIFSEGFKVVATTAWTAAFAEAAGADEIIVLAPAEMMHPSEYELRPSDVIAIQDADFFIYAGYERVMRNISDSLELDDSKKIQITTRYDWPTLTDSIRTIANRLDTSELAEENILEIRSFYDEAIDILKNEGLFGAKVLAHFHQQALLRSWGFNIIELYGPAPLEAADIVRLSSAEEIDLIVDNIHNPIGSALTETQTKSEYVVLMNFPGGSDTKSLLDVLRYNLEIILDN